MEICTKEELNELVSLWQITKDEKIIEKVLNSLTPLYKEIIKGFATNYEEAEDMLQESLISTIPCFTKWNPVGGSKFVSFACQRIKWRLISWFKINRNNTSKGLHRIDSTDEEEEIFSHLVTESKITDFYKKDMIDCFFQVLSEDDKFIINNFYLLGKTEVEIMAEANLTEKAISNRRYRALYRMKKFAKKNNIQK